MKEQGQSSERILTGSGADMRSWASTTGVRVGSTAHDLMQPDMASKCVLAMISSVPCVAMFCAIQPPTAPCLQRYIQDMDHHSEFGRAHDYYYDLEQESKRQWLDGDLCLPNPHHAKAALTVRATLTSPDQHHQEQEALEVKQRAKTNLRAFKEEYKASRMQSCTGA